MPAAKIARRVGPEEEPCKEIASIWLHRGPLAKILPRVGRAEPPLQRKRLDLAGEAPSRGDFSAKRLQGHQLGAFCSRGSLGRAESATIPRAEALGAPSRPSFFATDRHSATKKRGIAHQISRAASSRVLNSAQGACNTEPTAILCNCKSSRPAQRQCRTMRPVQFYRLPAELAYAVSSATAALSSSTRSRFSQVNSGSSRPKWP